MALNEPRRELLKRWHLLLGLLSRVRFLVLAWLLKGLNLLINELLMEATL
jgi:hypothetical protein